MAGNYGKGSKSPWFFWVNSYIEVAYFCKQDTRGYLNIIWGWKNLTGQLNQSLSFP